MIFQLYIFKDNTWQGLDLPSDFNLGLVQNSGFLGKIQSGSFSFTSTLPTTQNNCTILQNAENPQMVLDRKIQFPAKLLVGSTEYYTWYFVLRRANEKQYSFDLIQTPGNQPKTFYDLKLWQLDFGKLELNSILAQSNIWTINLYDAANLSKYFINPTKDTIVIGQPIPAPVWFELIINNVVVAESPEFDKDYYYDYWYNENDPEKRFLLCTKKITNYSVSMDIPKVGLGSINVVQTEPAFPINSVTIKIYSKSMFSVVGKGPIISTHNLTRLNYNDIRASLNSVVLNQNDYPFKFLTYFNDSYYPSDNTQYEGIVNQYNAQAPTLKLNDGTFKNLNTYPISPCFSIVFIFEKIAEMMGFTLNAEVFQNKLFAGDYYLGDLHLINNVDLAEQLAGTHILCNVYGKKITYSNFMPDMTVKEFIDAIRTTWCLSVDYDYNLKQIIVTKGKSVIAGVNVIDISDKLARMPTAEIIDKTYYQLGFKSADSTAISQQNYPTDQSIADDGRNYTKIEAGFTPVINNMDIDPMLTYDVNEGIPTVNETARSVIYLEQKNNHPSQKIAFYLGVSFSGVLIEGFGGSGKYASKSDNKNVSIILSWTNTATHKGLLETFYQEYLDFLNATTQWTTDIWLTELELANFNFSAKYYAYGMLFLVESLNPKLPIKDKTPIKLLSL